MQPSHGLSLLEAEWKKSNSHQARDPRNKGREHGLGFLPLWVAQLQIGHW